MPSPQHERFERDLTAIALGVLKARASEHARRASALRGKEAEVEGRVARHLSRCAAETRADLAALEGGIAGGAAA